MTINKVLLIGNLAGLRKPKRGDELDQFLSKMENPEHGVTVDDEMTGQGVVLR